MKGMRMVWLAGFLVLAALVLVPVSPALADGIIIPEPPPNVPIVDVPYLTIRYHRVSVTIVDQVATTHVDQVFVNEGPYEVEGTYIFPLPEDAAISEFSMWVEGEKLEGQVLEREEARRIYEDIVRRRRDPALLEYVGRDAFQASIYPIPPGGERRVEIEYSEILDMDNGLVEYVYPLNTEKFSPRPLEEVTVKVTIQNRDPLKAIYCSSHAVDLARRGDHNAVVGYEEVGVRPDRDFVLYYTVSPDDVGLNLLSYKPDRDGDGYFLLLAAPQVEVDTTQVVAKDVLLVLDVSGSMEGAKIAQAKEALAFVLDNLNDVDRFNVVSFSTSTRSYARGLVSANERGDASDFVQRLRAEGSTDINRALLEALTMADDERPTTLIFVTDGLPTVGEVDVDRIIDNVAGAAPDNVRIFPFGVGYDVNTALLDTMAQNHRGVSGYVRPEESIEEKVSAFYAKVSTPLLADLDLDMTGVDVVETYPYPLPDLFAGGQLVVVGRYRDGGATRVSLSGTVNGNRETFRYDDLSLAQEGGEEFIARLWATRKIGYLLRQVRLHGEDDELIEEIVELSIRYGIITPYTSFLVEETEMALTKSGREELADETMAQATSMPAPAVGVESVQRSSGEQKLAEAEAPAEMALPEGMEGNAPTDSYGNVVNPVQYVGDKTFILYDNVWTDTTFDAEQMETEAVHFGSEDYFTLVAMHPEWGRYFALGDHVIVVIEGQAYEVVGDGATSQRESERGGELDIEAANVPLTENPSPQNLVARMVQAIANLVQAVAEQFDR